MPISGVLLLGGCMADTWGIGAISNFLNRTLDNDFLSIIHDILGFPLDRRRHKLISLGGG